MQLSHQNIYTGLKMIKIATFWCLYFQRRVCTHLENNVTNGCENQSRKIEIFELKQDKEHIDCEQRWVFFEARKVRSANY